MVHRPRGESCAPRCQLHSAPRRALVLNYFAHGTRSRMDGCLMKGLPAVVDGQALGGKFHPIVFDTRRLDMASLPVAAV